MDFKHRTPRGRLAARMSTLFSAPRGIVRRGGTVGLEELGRHHLRDIGFVRDRPADPFRHLLRF